MVLNSLLLTKYLFDTGPTSVHFLYFQNERQNLSVYYYINLVNIIYIIIYIINLYNKFIKRKWRPLMKNRVDGKTDYKKS